jgi:hypothetical protein
MPRRCDPEIKCEGLLVQVQVELSTGDILQQRIQSWPLLAALGATDALIAIDRHDRPAKPPSGLLERACSRRSGHDHWSRPGHTGRHVFVLLYRKYLTDRQGIKQ